ncbi:MAG: tetratricopeptide repeat protein [Gemmatimonadales bacterium]|nr:MAG: tetratricopeptide repeat protein [Gemmatimonadales bacterium]
MPVSDPIDQEIRILRAIFWSDRDPEGRAFVPLADAYLRKGSPDEAISLLEDGLGRHPEFSSAHMVAARAYRAMGARGAVHRALDSVLALDPGNASALRMKGEIAESDGNSAVALTAFREALDRNPDFEDLAGRIQRLALGVPTVDPGGSSSFDPDPSGLDGPDEAQGGQGQIDTGLIDFPPDVGIAGLPDAEAPDAAFPDAEAPDAAFPDAEPRPVGQVEDVPGPMDTGDLDFGLEDFPPDERASPSGSLAFDPEPLLPDRPELEPAPPSGEGDSFSDRRARDFEAHESLLAEQDPRRPGEMRSGEVPDPDPGHVDLIDPFGFELSTPAAGAPTPPRDRDPSDAPSSVSMTPDEAEPDAWRLPADAGGGRGGAGIEPLPVTRTLGELYARQGLTSQAVEVFEALLERSPGDETLRARLSELRPEPAEDTFGTASDSPSVASESGHSPRGHTGAGEDGETGEAPETGEESETGSDMEIGEAETDEDGEPGRQAVLVRSDFSPAEHPIGSWFEDLLAWSPGAIPVGHLAPGAVPIESLAPEGWPSRTEVSDPTGATEGTSAPREVEVHVDPESGAEPVSEPVSESVAESVVEPVPEQDHEVTQEAAAVTSGPAGEDEALPSAPVTPPARQLDSAASDSEARSSSTDDEGSPPVREEGFEGLDDFQDWLRSLDR